LDDTDVFWPKWYDLLEHVLTGQSYEMTFMDSDILRSRRDMVAEGTMDPAEAGPIPYTNIIATTLNHQRHFRLQIFETDDRYTDFLIVDEVIDAYQLAGVFLKEFEKLLEGYHPYQDFDGQIFDLRTLPVERLQERLSTIV
jgi:hypothetical protein